MEAEAANLEKRMEAVSTNLERQVEAAVEADEIVERVINEA